ncbi:hypothetical protein DMC14_000915 [Metamycoplasma phocicerebrale]|uniref:Uncharacterized protein n=1 Tax=Metamycoplasma phocicerebrale TaxID=142649 RepID=A0A3Q9VBI0_9BACT|nr:hypothetical protein [Metamycoplasma phocicerebrale]AZZ65354.1 hypothetical protein DMC14_000915 [Metamycoplasma phocicerebrale]
MYLKEKEIYIEDKQNKEKINIMHETLISILGNDIDNKINHARFYYNEENNMYFIAQYKDIWVQIRIPKKTNMYDYETERKIIKNFKDYLFIKDGIIIKKWFPGADLFQIKLNSKVIYSILNCIKNFQSLNIEVKKFNWNKFRIYDKKYHELLHGYKDDELVLSHNNIQKHNIIINKYGFVKLVDFENSSLNNPYFDLVSLYLYAGLDKNTIIEFFDLNEQKFNDFIYLINTYREAEYKKDYCNLTINKNKTPETLNLYKSKNVYENKFIVHKSHNQFDNRLIIDKIKHFYFVPMHIYEDDNKVIWRWLNNNTNFEINSRTIKIIAKAMRTYHDSEVEFPSNILEQKVNWYLENINKKDLFLDIGAKDFIDEILSWIENLEIDANCHNNLNLSNILWGENQNIFIIDWSVAYKSSRFLDIALMFENLHVNSNLEAYFWKTYTISKPKDFYKYRIIVLFTEYLYSKILNGDLQRAKNNAKRIKEILVEEHIKQSK